MKRKKQKPPQEQSYNIGYWTEKKEGELIGNINKYPDAFQELFFTLFSLGYNSPQIQKIAESENCFLLADKEGMFANLGYNRLIACTFVRFSQGTFEKFSECLKNIFKGQKIQEWTYKEHQRLAPINHPEYAKKAIENFEIFVEILKSGVATYTNQEIKEAFVNLFNLFKKKFGDIKQDYEKINEANNFSLLANTIKNLPFQALNILFALDPEFCKKTIEGFQFKDLPEDFRYAYLTGKFIFLEEIPSEKETIELINWVGIKSLLNQKVPLNNFSCALKILGEKAICLFEEAGQSFEKENHAIYKTYYLLAKYYSLRKEGNEKNLITETIKNIFNICYFVRKLDSKKLNDVLENVINIIGSQNLKNFFKYITEINEINTESLNNCPIKPFDPNSNNTPLAEKIGLHTVKSLSDFLKFAEENQGILSDLGVLAQNSLLGIDIILNNPNFQEHNQTLIIDISKNPSHEILFYQLLLSIKQGKISELTYGYVNRATSIAEKSGAKCSKEFKEVLSELCGNIAVYLYKLEDKDSYEKIKYYGKIALNYSIDDFLKEKINNIFNSIDEKQKEEIPEIAEKEEETKIQSEPKVIAQKATKKFIEKSKETVKFFLSKKQSIISEEEKIQKINIEGEEFSYGKNFVYNERLGAYLAFSQKATNALGENQKINFNKFEYSNNVTQIGKDLYKCKPFQKIDHRFLNDSIITAEYNSKKFKIILFNKTLTHKEVKKIQNEFSIKYIDQVLEKENDKEQKIYDTSFLKDYEGAEHAFQKLSGELNNKID